MSCKRKLEIAETDFVFLHKLMGSLAKKSPADAKSFLLFVKTLIPNSSKLKLIEYGFAKDNGDSSAASQHLSQLCASHRDSLRDEVNCLFGGIRSTPPNQLSIDIFIKLTPTAQRDTLSIYFEQFSDTLKADTLICLLGIREIRAQTQLVPTLLTWAFDSLHDGEQSLVHDGFRESRLDPHTDIPDVSEKPAVAIPVSSNEIDEGEEGEVIGDDEEEDEEDDEVGTTTLLTSKRDGQVTNRKQVINIYRLRIAYDLLPIAHKVHGLVKFNRKLLEKIAVNALSFLFNYLSFVPRDPPILGTEKTIQEQCKVHPIDYVVSCMRMIGDLFQWPHTITTRINVSDALEPRYIVLPKKDLLNTFEDCLSELHKHPMAIQPPTKRRSSMRKSEDHYAHLKAVMYQCACLFLYIFNDAAFEYLNQQRSCLFLGFGEDFLSHYPVNLCTIFSMRPSNFVSAPADNNESLPFLLSRLLRHRKYSVSRCKYSFGHKELDSLISKLGPQLPSRDVSLERIIYIDLMFLGLVDPQSFLPFGTEMSGTDFPCIYPHNDRDFLRWLSSAYPTNIFASFDGVDTHQRRCWFVQNFPTIADVAPKKSALPVCLGSECWMIPFTQNSVHHFGCRVISHWLSHLLEQRTNSVNVDATCLLAVLGQMDSLTDFDSEFSKDHPLPYGKVISNLQQNWSMARVKFIEWFTSYPKLFVDASLLNQIARLESGFHNVESDHARILEACVNCLTNACKVDFGVRLCQFIESESALILSCLRFIDCTEVDL
ncbi:hypothetical protein EG68_09390 [Paragonimus skrjabini miyazakii]|uniref:Uncharacterized protein n=1 Tax=Paragonimus skrjabini miyazakii TaxID=59628 RepID=A0A8S9YGB4_9TREM|nr:hypothetical protein EG68_09390 [Paragonimus skrjabini miyazakii]